MQQRSHLQRAYLLPPLRGGTGGATSGGMSAGTFAASLRERTHPPSLKISDPAVHAMSDFQQDAAQTVGEEVQLECALDQMFRQGVRALVVVREGAVTGLLTLEQAQAAARRVAEAMTPVADVPAIDWQVIESSQVRDLVEIFEGSGAHHLVVVENDGANLARIRGLVDRDRLRRQLGALWGASRPGS